VTSTTDSIPATVDIAGLDSRDDQIVQRLVDDYGTVLGEDAVRGHVREAAAAIGVPRIPQFVPIFIEREARRRIQSEVVRL